jgi:hypothetical protein
MSETNQAIEEYEAHKAVCTMPYDPYRTPRQCPECARLIDIVAQATIDEKKEVKDV